MGSAAVPPSCVSSVSAVQSSWPAHVPAHAFFAMPAVVGIPGIPAKLQRDKISTLKSITFV